jgi:hypothetical protein
VEAAGWEDAVVNLGCLGEASSQAAARHHGNPGAGAIARRPPKAKPIEASDASGQSRTTQKSCAVQETVKPALPRETAVELLISFPQGKL